MVAEYGIAAHWRYKQGATNDETLIEKIARLRQLLEWQQESKDADEYLRTSGLISLRTRSLSLPPRAM